MENIISLFAILGVFILYTSFLYELFLNIVLKRGSIYIKFVFVDICVYVIEYLTPVPLMILYPQFIWYYTFWWCLTTILVFAFVL